MSSQIISKCSSTTRYERYKTVIDSMACRQEFRLEQIHSDCSAERPAFVTRLVNELEREGWIVCESSSPSSGYRWNRRRGNFVISRWLDHKLFGTQLKGSPEQDRPRERLLAQGAEKLTDAELLAILIRSGRPGESAVVAGDRLARAYAGRMEELPQAGRAELKEISRAVEKTAYCQIMAGIELGRRAANLGTAAEKLRIRSTSDATAFCERHFSRLAAAGRQEEFHIVTLDTKNQVIDTHQITVGTLDASLVHPREVFRPAIKDASASVILVHNHPSGDPTPSQEDVTVTRRLESAGELLGILVLDHIVLGAEKSVSIREFNC